MSSRAPNPRRPGRQSGPGLRITPGRVIAVAAPIVVAVLTVMILTGSRSGSHATTSASTAPAAPTHTRSSGSGSGTKTATGTASIPILVYHVINTQPAGSSASPALYVPADEFSSQMQALKAAGWHAVTLNQAEAYWTKGTSLGAGKPIILTFDNGYASHYTNALPALRQLGWTGVEDLQITGLPSSEGGLTDTQIRGLIAAGWELDTQGMSHVDLTTLSASQLTSEIASARQTLQTRYGVPVNWFSYPSGDYNSTVVAAVRAAGYLGATTVNRGWARPNGDRFRLPRLVVTGGTSPSQLLAQINAAESNTSFPSSYTALGLA
jgi:peptidoglycan/xylan/chitin deacetylase (PgdA/CDA1 family)